MVPVDVPLFRAEQETSLFAAHLPIGLLDLFDLDGESTRIGQVGFRGPDCLLRQEMESADDHDRYQAAEHQVARPRGQLSAAHEGLFAVLPKRRLAKTFGELMVLNHDSSLRFAKWGGSAARP